MLRVFDDNPYRTNCWILAAEGGDEAIVVDPGFAPERVRAMLADAGLRAAAVLLTHAHVDHAGSAGLLAGDDVPVYVHPADAPAFDDYERWGGAMSATLARVKDLRTVEDGEVVSLAGFEVEVRHTPGHTPGHAVFLTDARVFSGDLVFAGSIGRSDFPNSDPAAMGRSLRWFLTLDDALPVQPGHGRDTTVGRERGSNPVLVGLAG
jgi:glyoxylase-like metal-dependent hydrolase (beta-lactamase superfamily II)